MRGGLADAKSRVRRIGHFGRRGRAAPFAWMRERRCSFGNDPLLGFLERFATVVSAITLDREDVPVGILEPGDFAAARAR
jgi:hypothetical protein